MEGKIKFEFSTSMWKHSSPGGWFFVSLPKIISEEIREHLKWQEEGWGRMKTIAQISNVTWETAIWFDTAMGTYLLPVKTEIRRKLNLEINRKIEITIWI